MFKGGNGKTTLATNLAGSLAENNKKVLFVDVTVNGDGQNSFLVRPSLYSMGDYLNGNVDNIKKCLQRVTKNLDIFPVNRNFSDYHYDKNKLHSNGELMKFIEDSLAELKSEYDYILVDTSSGSDVLTDFALKIVDYVIIPSNLDYYSRNNLEETFMKVMSVKEKDNPRLNVLGIVPTKTNMATSGEHDSLLYIKEIYESDCFATYMPISHHYSEALFKHKQVLSLCDDRNYEKEKRRLRHLAKEIEGKLVRVKKIDVNVEKEFIKKPVKPVVRLNA